MLDIHITIDRKQKVRMVPRLGRIVERVGPTPAPIQASPICKGHELMAFTMTATQQVEVTVEFKDAKGNPATVDGTPVWQTDNPSILGLTPSADGKTCTVVATGMIGTANVQVTADADLGPDVKQIIGTLEVEITPGQAQMVSITPGTPTEQP